MKKVSKCVAFGVNDAHGASGPLVLAPVGEHPLGPEVDLHEDLLLDWVLKEDQSGSLVIRHRVSRCHPIIMKVINVSIVPGRYKVFNVHKSETVVLQCVGNLRLKLWSPSLITIVPGATVSAIATVWVHYSDQAVDNIAGLVLQFIGTNQGISMRRIETKLR